MEPRELADKVVGDLFADRFDDVEAVVKPEGRKALSAKKIGKVWSRLNKAGGAHQATGEPLEGNVPGAHLYDYPLTFERIEAHLQIVVADGEVAGLLVRPGAPTGEWNK